MRVCGVCGEVKAIDAFSVDRSSRDGLNRYCRACNAAKWNKYQDRNAERIRANALAWYYENRDRARANNKAWAISHRRQRQEYARRRYAALSPDKRETILARNREYSQRWCKANRHKLYANCERYRARKRGAVVQGVVVGHVEIALRRAMFGGRCYICGAENAGAIDHVIPLSRGGLHVPANLRPICTRCNSSKHAKDWRLFVGHPHES